MSKGWNGESKRHSDVQLKDSRFAIPQELKDKYLANQISTEEYNRKLDAVEKRENPDTVKNKNVPPEAYSAKISENTINLLMRRMNHGKIEFDDIPFPEEGYELTAEQTKKGLDWLMDKWKSPTGVERKNSPFGEREHAILTNFKEFRLIDFFDAGNSYAKYYIPVYEVIGNEDSFEYHISRSSKSGMEITG